MWRVRQLSSVREIGDGTARLVNGELAAELRDSPATFTAQVAEGTPGTSQIQIRLGNPGTGPVVGTATVASTGDVYSYTTTSAHAR